MGGAADGNSALSTIEGFRGSTADQGQCLKGFQRGSDEGLKVGLTGSHQHPAAAVAHHGVHTVGGFNRRTTFEMHLERW